MARKGNTLVEVALMHLRDHGPCSRAVLTELMFRTSHGRASNGSEERNSYDSYFYTPNPCVVGERAVWTKSGDGMWGLTARGRDIARTLKAKALRPNLIRRERLISEIVTSLDKADENTLLAIRSLL